MHSPVDSRGTKLWWLSWAPPSVWERSPPPPRPLWLPLLVEVCLATQGTSYLEISLKRICVPFFFFSKWVLGLISLGKVFTVLDKVCLALVALTSSSCLIPDGSFGFSTARLVGLQFENRAFLFWNVMMWALENVPLMIVTKTLMHFVLFYTRETKKKTKTKKNKMTKKKRKTKTNIKTKVPMMIATKTLMHFVLSSPRKPASLSTCSTTENNFLIEPIFFQMLQSFLFREPYLFYAAVFSLNWSFLTDLIIYNQKSLFNWTDFFIGPIAFNWLDFLVRGILFYWIDFFNETNLFS